MADGPPLFSGVYKHLSELDPGRWVRNLAQTLANTHRAVSDPSHQGSLAALATGKPMRAILGTITDGTALSHVYRVQLEHGWAPTIAIFCPRTSHAAGGVRELTTLQPGTQVICLMHDKRPWAHIIATLPQPSWASNEVMMSVLLQSSRQRVDAGQRAPYKTASNGNIVDFSAGRPFDSTLAGETGWISDTGIRIWLDSFMAQLGVDEACSITAFLHDQLLRIAAHNLQVWTPGSEREGFDDQGEYNDWTGYTPYPWENFGCFTREDPPFQINTAQEWQQDRPEEGKVEPRSFWQQPWQRTRHFQGYLGQGGKRLIQVRPANASGQFKYKQDGEEPPQFPGVFDEVISLAGHWSVQSAKAVSITKRIAVVSPTRTVRPEQPARGTPAGDDETNYKAAGIIGAGPDHKITSSLRTQGEEPALNRATGLLDLHAYIFNYSGLHAFAYHAEDYDTPQESELEHTDGKSIEVPEYSQLGGQQYIDPEPFRREWPVDHRYNVQSFWQLQSGLELLEDGGVVLYDGFGSEIRMTGGSIFISAPGDVWLQSGRNVITWGGRDIHVRAQHSIDITASDADVRMKAEHNMQILAGNDKIGGILIESRATGPIYKFEEQGEKVASSGIMLRAPKSEVVSWSRNVYLRTGGGSGDGAVEAGTIVLDADRGKQDVIVHARVHCEFIDQACIVGWGTESNFEKASWYSKDFNSLAGQLLIDGSCFVGGQLITKNDIFVADGHIATSEGGPANKFDGPGLAQLQAAAETPHEYATINNPQFADQMYDNLLDKLFYQEGRAGHDEVIGQAQVGLRTMADYRSDDFKLYESRWQHMSRLAGHTLSKWKEKIVKWHGQDTYPYPGKEKFTSPTFRWQDLKIFDMPERRPQDRGDGHPFEPAGPYADPEYAEPTPQMLDEDYMVILP